MKLRLPSFLSKKRDTTNAINPKDWFINQFGAKAPSGEVVNKYTALKLTAVYRCIATNAETVAGLPKMIIKEENKERMLNDPVFPLIHLQPNPLMTAFIFWETVMIHLQTDGNAYCPIKRNVLGYPVRIDLIEDPENVSIFEIDGDLYYKYKAETYTSYDILHFKGLSMNGLKGRSPIRIAMDAIGLGLSGQSFGSDYFSKGLTQPGLIEMEQSMTDPEWQAFQQHWKESYVGAENTNNVPILEGGGKWKNLGIPLDQAQYISTREFTVEEICRIFNVPPPIAFDLRRAHFSNIEHLDMQYAKYCIKGYAKRIEQECDIKLFPKAKWGKKGIKFSLEGLLRGDLRTRTQYYRTAVVTGWMTRQQVRSLENMPPGPEYLDEYLTPLNMQSGEVPKDPNNPDNEDHNEQKYMQNGSSKKDIWPG
ncbi:MAG: phage portal protein [Bacteroidales bacterium]